MPIPESLTGRTALVTGAGRGMGRAVAQALSARGATVVVNDTNMGDAARTVAGLVSAGTQAIAVRADVTKAGEVRTLVARALDRFGAVHILVNNAGILRPTRFLDISEAEWDLVVNVSLKGTFLCSQAVLPSMQAAGWGRIVNFSSTAGKTVSTLGGAHYTAAKTAVLGLTRAIAKEFARSGVTVNAVCPGLIDTEMVRTTVSEERIRTYGESFPIPRLGRPEEVAELVAFLCSDRAAYITGAAFDITGGDLMV